MLPRVLPIRGANRDGRGWCVALGKNPKPRVKRRTDSVEDSDRFSGRYTEPSTHKTCLPMIPQTLQNVATLQKIGG